MLGGAVGAVGGGISIINGGDWEKMADAAAWGYLIGAVVGLGIGIYEAPIITGRNQETSMQIVPAVLETEGEAAAGLGLRVIF